MGRKGYGCSEYRNGCSFVIWKTSFGKSLSEAMVRSLIEKGKTSLLTFKQNNGDDVRARLILADPATGALKQERA